MYSKDDILTLAKAGFSAQQIAALNNVGTAAPAAPAATAATAATAAPAAPAATAATAAPAAPAAPAQDPLSQILAQLQTNAINSTQQPAVQTTDEILASIINPTVKGGATDGSK